LEATTSAGVVYHTLINNLT